MKHKTLLQKAKKIQHKTRGGQLPISIEHIELAINWMQGNVSLLQLNRVLGYKQGSGNCLYRVAVWLRKGYQLNMIKVSKKKYKKFTQKDLNRIYIPHYEKK